MTLDNDSSIYNPFPILEVLLDSVKCLVGELYPLFGNSI